MSPCPPVGESPPRRRRGGSGRAWCPGRWPAQRARRRLSVEGQSAGLARSMARPQADYPGGGRPRSTGVIRYMTDGPVHRSFNVRSLELDCKKRAPAGPKDQLGVSHVCRHRDRFRVICSGGGLRRSPGNEVYPFHLGDLNLATPENMVAASCGRSGTARPVTARTPAWRRYARPLAANVTPHTGWSYSAENVAIAARGKPVISKFILALMNPGDEVLYPNPGFPIYESQIEFHGGVAVPYGFLEGADGFADRSRRPRGRHHAAHPAADRKRPTEPHGRRVLPADLAPPRRFASSTT